MAEVRLTDDQQRLWTAAAGLGPIVLLAAGCGWTTVLVTLAIAGAAAYLPAAGQQKQGSIGAGLCRILITLVNAESLQRFSAMWPEQKWVPVILLMLACLGAWKGRGQAAQGGILLLWLTGTLLGAVLISGIPQIRLLNLKPGPPDFEGAAALLTVFLLLESGTSAEKRRKIPWGKLGLVALAASICTQGVLSERVQTGEGNPFYLLSRSVDFLGGMKRMESLTILAVLIGAYLWMEAMLCRVEGNPWKTGASAAVSAVLYIVSVRIPTEALLLMAAAVEYILPVLGRKLMKKEK